MKSSKSKKAEQTAAEQSQAAEYRAAEAERTASEKAKQELVTAGKTAREQMISSGEPSGEETARLGRYRTKAMTPGEQLMTQSGAISQAVARRIQERIDKPGLDYDTGSEAYTEGVTQPIWRALKRRGIAPPPGEEGGGLGTTQYMKEAVPALAELRQRSISEDIGRASEYSDKSRALQELYEELEGLLGEAIQGRRYESGMRGAEAEQAGVAGGAPYGVRGAEAYGRGQTSAAAINQEEVNRRYAGKEAEKAAIGKSVGKAVGAALMLVPGGQVPGAAILAASSGDSGLSSALSSRQGQPGSTATVSGMGRVPVAPPDYYESPSARILARRTAGRG